MYEMVDYMLHLQPRLVDAKSPAALMIADPLSMVAIVLHGYTTYRCSAVLLLQHQWCAELV